MITFACNKVLAAITAGGTLAIAMTAIAALHAQNPLVTGKSITLPEIGATQNVGSLPMNLVTTADGKYAISSDMGYRQSLVSIDTQTGTSVSHIDFNTPTTANPANGLYYGLAICRNWDGSSTLYASQGANSTIAIIKVGTDGTLKQTGSIAMHNHPGDVPAGLALDARGYLYVAVNEWYSGGINDLITPGSLAVIDTTTGSEVGRYRFAIPKGPIFPSNFPYAVTALSDGSKVYVTSQRDGRVYVINAENPTDPSLAGMFSTGTHPVALKLSRDARTLYVANAGSDTVSQIDTETNKIVNTILLRPTGAETLTGATPTNLGLSVDGTTLYATLGDMNAVAVIDTASAALKGYIPVGWYPAGVAATPTHLLIANAKGTVTRNPNPTYVQWSFAGQYDLNIIEGNVETLGYPTAAQLAGYTAQVLSNNKITATTATPDNPLQLIGRSAGKIQHVIYVIKENRTYDQVLGDLPQGDGNPSLAEFGARVTPNLHALATRFVLLDNFYDCGEASGDGWPWSTSSYANEYVIKNLPYNYSGRGRNYDFEGQNNGYPVGGFPATDPDGTPYSQAFPEGLPAITDVSQASAGHIWDDAERTGLSYRNYGFFYTFGVTGAIPDNYPAAAGLQPPGHDGTGKSDPDFRRFDTGYPDSDAPEQVYKATGNPAALFPETQYGKHAASSRFDEWNTEFQAALKADPTGKSIPAFTTVRLMNDHTNGFAAGYHSPRSLVADNDYGVAELVQAVSNSPIWAHTAIFVIEDDAQDGPDHVDSHRSTCYVISPYIQQSSVDHTFYNTDSVLKSIELLLGLKPLSQYDAVATPIMDWAEQPLNNAPFQAIPESSTYILQHNPTMAELKPGTEARKLALLASKMDFVHPDSADPHLTNEMIWKSIYGMNTQMPEPRHGLKLAQGGARTVKADEDQD